MSSLSFAGANGSAPAGAAETCIGLVVNVVETEVADFAVVSTVVVSTTTLALSGARALFTPKPSPATRATPASAMVRLRGERGGSGETAFGATWAATSSWANAGGTHSAPLKLASSLGCHSVEIGRGWDGDETWPRWSSSGAI